MTSFVHEGVQGVKTGTNSIRIGKRGEVGHGGDPSTVRFEPSRLRPVTESIRIFVFAVKKVKVHSCSTVFNTEGGVTSSPLLNSQSEREIRI